MHEIDGDGYLLVAGHRYFDDEDLPTRDATQVTHMWANAVQEEIKNVIISTGASLNTSSETYAQMIQLNTAIDYKIAQVVASTLPNDSSVPGTYTDDALDYLLTAIQNKITRGYIDGLNISCNNNSATLDVWVDFAPGFCMDRLNGMPLTNSSTIRKLITTAWAAGTNQGGWAGSTGTARTDWYHYCFIIYRNSDGAIDFGFDDNPQCVNLLSASGYNRYRRVGACYLNSSSKIRGFRQEGDWFYHFQDSISETVDLNTGSSGYKECSSIVIPNPDNAFGNRYEVGFDVRKILISIEAPVNNDSGSGVHATIWPFLVDTDFAPVPSTTYFDAANDASGNMYFSNIMTKPFPEETNIAGILVLRTIATPSAACNITYRCYGYEDTRGKHRS